MMDSVHFHAHFDVSDSFKNCCVPRRKQPEDIFVVDKHYKLKEKKRPSKKELTDSQHRFEALVAKKLEPLNLEQREAIASLEKRAGITIEAPLTRDKIERIARALDEILQA